MNKSKINPEIKNKLFSSDTNKVLEAINSLKEIGNSDYLPILFELLQAEPEQAVEKEILKLLGTIKDKETVPAFIDALKNPKFSKIKKELLTTCWQNGLDFSPYMDLLVDIIINDEWATAFEAFTTIENLEHFPPENEMKDIKLKIAGALKVANEQKSYFLEEILRMTP